MAIKVIIAAHSPLNSQLLSRALERSKKHFAVVGCEHTGSGAHAARPKSPASTIRIAGRRPLPARVAIPLPSITPTWQ